MKKGIRSKGIIPFVVLGSFLVAHIAAQAGLSIRTIARESLAVDGRMVTARVMNDREILYHEGLDQSSLSAQGGRLLVTTVTPGVNGVLVMRRNPTVFEEELWRKHFGVGVSSQAVASAIK